EQGASATRGSRQGLLPGLTLHLFNGKAQFELDQPHRVGDGVPSELRQPGLLHRFAERPRLERVPRREVAAFLVDFRAADFRVADLRVADLRVADFGRAADRRLPGLARDVAFDVARFAVLLAVLAA